MSSPPKYLWRAEDSVATPVSDNNFLSITILYAGIRVHAGVYPSVSGNNAEDQLIEEYKEPYDAEDLDQTVVVHDKIALLIVQKGAHIFQKSCVIPVSDDLHAFVFPTEIYCSLKTVNGELQVVEKDVPCTVDIEEHPQWDEYPEDDEVSEADIYAEDDYIPRSSLRNTDHVKDLTRYSTKVIHVLQRLESYGGGYIVHALVEGLGRECCVKVFDDRNYRAVQREFDCLLKISQSRYADTLRAPKLLGLVESATDGRQIGIVEEYITHAETYEMSNLGRIGEVGAVELDRRRKWSLQIRETVAQLHEIGVVWGDAKPQNVLIDSNTDDIYIIDFGGGVTDGWGTEELMNTAEGDIQALKMIDKYLEV
ncbi:hypothetical protein F5B18DRAFT_657326 [Nemania serpens]|nr:hypothetical protein F5B18DRAFT_657326 [Nemania serpens]